MDCELEVNILSNPAFRLQKEIEKGRMLQAFYSYLDSVIIQVKINIAYMAMNLQFIFLPYQ